MSTRNVVTSLSEAAREREVFKYFPPTSLNPADSTQLPRSSYDTALNAFSQCAALRLNAQRCLISLFTRKWQYIIAEATRTLSLQRDEMHDGFDELWRGVGAIPHETGPCLQAFSFFCGPEKPEFLVFPDLTNDNAYRKLPYVSGPPGMRFFASVPITSPSGIVIGTFAVCNNVARDSVATAELIFLKNMATATIQHLEICKAQRGNHKAERMIKGLGLYVEGKSTLRDWWLITGHKSQLRKANDGFREGKTLGQLADDEFGLQDPYGSSRSKQTSALRRRNIVENRPMIPKEDEDEDEDSTSHTHSRTQSDNSCYARSATLDPKSAVTMTVDTELASLPHNLLSAQNKETPEGSMVSDTESADYADMPTLSAAKSQRMRSNSEGARLQQVVLASDLRDTFSNASNLIRESLLVEGCLFLDASVGSFGGKSKKRRMPHKPPSAWKTSKSPLVTSSGDEENRGSNQNADDMRTKVETPEDKFCGMLGYSTSKRSSLNIHEALDVHLTAREGFLQSLLKRYPHGRIFNFDEDGNNSIGEDEVRRAMQTTIHNFEGRTSVESSERRQQRRSRKKELEGREIARISPGVQSVAFFPLWNSHAESWFAGCLVWSVDISQNLGEDDLVYLAAFGNSIMAEVSRLNALVAAQMGTNFVSS